MSRKKYIRRVFYGSMFIDNFFQKTEEGKKEEIKW
jgi:hypothetical protein